MINSSLAQAIVNPNTPDPLQAFQRGQAIGKKRKTSSLAGRAIQGDADAFSELQTLDPEVGLAIGESIRATSAKDVNDFIRDAKITQGLLSSDPNRAAMFLENRIQGIEARGGNSNESRMILEQINSGDYQGAMQNLSAFTTAVSDAQNLKTYAPMVDPETGEVYMPAFDPNTGGATRIPIEGATQLTPAQKIAAEQKSKIDVEQEKTRLSGRESALKTAVDRGAKLFDKIEPMDSMIRNYDEAIELLSADDANTGIVASYMPSVRDTAIKMDNLIKRLGLDVVGSTTFGALSESELKFALDSAVPKSLESAELKQWFIDKRNGQRKIRAGLQEVATFLSSGKHTLDEWMEYDKGRAAPASDPMIEADQDTSTNIGGGFKILSVEG